MPSPYQVLGVAVDASTAQIQRAFRAKAKLLHPDVNASPAAAEQFARVQQAYELLSDPASRRAFDLPPPSAHAPSGAVREARYTWTNIAGTPSRRPASSPHAHDPGGFDELYRAFFQTRVNPPASSPPEPQSPPHSSRTAARSRRRA